MEGKNDLLNSVMIAFIAQMDAAMEIAKLVSEHGGEEELSADSLIAGLVYRLMIPMNDEEMKKSLDNANEIVNEEEEEEEEDEDYDFGTDDVTPETNDHGDRVIVSRKVKRNNCECDVCKKVRECFDKFYDHETNDQLAQMFKDAIKNACDIHNLTI
jgi:hypothetical protein